MTSLPLRPIKFAAIGLDHRHIYEMVGRLIEHGAECVGWWTQGEPQPLAGFLKRYPDIPRVDDKRRLLEDPDVRLILSAAIPADRASIAIAAMQHGKDVMVDKPGVTTDAQLDAVQAIPLLREVGRSYAEEHVRIEHLI